MKSAFSKDTLRSISRSLGRFIAIAVIVALGTGFYAGLRMTPPDMKKAADLFYDGTDLMDIRVVSTLGLSDADIDALRDVEGVENVMPAYETDVVTTVNGEQYATRVHSLPDAAKDSDTSDGVTAVSDDDDYLNRPLLVEGTWPTREGECVLSADKKMNEPAHVGDTVQIAEWQQDDALTTGTYTVTGFVRSSYYATSSSMGTTTLGSGSIQQFMYVPESDFSPDLPYSEAFITVVGAKDEFSGGDAYQARVSAVMDRIGNLAPEREQARTDELRREAQDDLDERRAEYEREKADALAQLDAAASQIGSGQEAVEQGGSEYEDGLRAYEQKKAEAEDGFADAERQLDEAQKQIDDWEDASWFIMDRDKNYGVASFDADADRVASIAAVFPFIFFLVAALVALTSMTRMVEEERVLIGTYKALGYGKGRIASKYLVYAAVASGAGGVIGIAFLSQLLPAVIMEAYGIIYFVPLMPLPLPLEWSLVGLSFGLGVGVTLFATAAAAAATLRERPAALMLPRAPKAGKRILLERVAPLWRRMSFSWKVTFRNLFRYKRRFIMTVIGIAGCTALLLTGLGLSDAINDIIDKQFGEITRYNTSISLDEDKVADGAVDVDAVLDDGDLVSAHTSALRENMLASGPGDSDREMELVVPEYPSGFHEFFDLRTRVGHEEVELADDGLVLTEKLARELGVGVGDTVTLGEQDSIGNPTDTRYEAEVTGIAENYISHYAFMGPGLYERLFGEEPVYDTEFAVVTSDVDERERFGEELGAIDGVKTITYNDEIIDTYRGMLSSVNMVVIVLVVAAAALAFVVLYNLTNINITERMREIATLKVLGFTRREINAYIFRETILLAVIGCLVGLVLGVWMEGLIVVTAEVDQAMFGREIHLMSFVIAFALTMVFTAIVMFAMRSKLTKINMVESLKSNE